ncbi:odorant receptor 74a-like [Teleopsis dalmanni]|uniref:odorant receptor 74a-like n=1 Tax=Teleopsis dalmanni TaxID=139649 RepID=UPI0018CD4EC6|nr:odorant receptor 74a-like [Teleopsis dalmanni]
MHYMPRLKNGKSAPITWQISALFAFNTCWPLKDNATLSARCWYKIKFFILILIAIYVLMGEILGIYANINEIKIALEAGLSLLISFELVIRIINFRFRNATTRKIIEEFYLDIYIEKNIFPHIFKEIQEGLKPAVICSYSYVFATIFFVLIPIVGIVKGQKVFPFILDYPYDYTSWIVYIPSVACSIALAVIIVAHMIGESNLLATIILHLNARFQLLERDILSCGYRTLKANDELYLTMAFRDQLIELVKRNFKLRKYCKKVQQLYSMQFFIIMSMSSLLICSMAFEIVQIGLAIESCKYVCWILAKFVELSYLCKLGSTLTNKTNDISTAYYASDWEGILTASGNRVENIQTLNLLRLAIVLNQKPFTFTGFQFINISLETCLKILKAASSYFMFLQSMR